VGADIGSEGIGAGEAAGASGADDIDVVAGAGVVTTRVTADAEVAADAREAAVRVTTDPGEMVEVEVLAGAAVEAVEKAPGAGRELGATEGASSSSSIQGRRKQWPMPEKRGRACGVRCQSHRQRHGRM
jgi:hypothetical protein